jgi:hypothetical protein
MVEMTKTWTVTSMAVCMDYARCLCVSVFPAWAG